MDRLLQNQSNILNATWENAAGAQFDPGTGVLVTITRDDGTTVVTGQAASGTGPTRTFSVTPAQTNLLDHWTISWVATDGSTLTTYAEIVGGFHFSVAAARQRSPLQDATAYPASAIVAYRTLAEMAIEDICGVAFVPRYSLDVASIANYGCLSVPRRRIRKVRNIYTATDVGSTAVPSLTGVRIENGALIFMPSMWNWWSQPITVGYEHGYNETPPRVGRAALELARRWLVESPWDERLTGFKTRDGGEMTILSASHTDPFDIPEVVAVADAYGTPMLA